MEKGYDQLKINNNENFLLRMMFDIYKRQTKESRFKIILESKKIKIKETDRLETFNRLINDANRRITAQNKLENMKNELNEEENYNKKTYTDQEWLAIYKKRYIRLFT